MDWNPLTWTFATTFFGISLLKWGLVIGGIIFLALLRKFLLASVRSPRHEGNEAQTPSVHAHMETITVASTPHHENNTHSSAVPVMHAQRDEVAPSPQAVAVKEFKQAVVVAKQKRKSISKKHASKIATAKAITSKKISARKKAIAPIPADATSAPASSSSVRPHPSANPKSNTRTDGIVITDSIISERKANARAATTASAVSPASTPQKINSAPATDAPAKKAKAVVKKKVAKKKIIPAATELSVVASAAVISAASSPKDETAPAKTETAPRAATKGDSVPEKKAAVKNNPVKKKLVKKIVTKAATEKQAPLQKVSAPETKSVVKSENEKSPTPTGKPVRMRNPGFI